MIYGIGVDLAECARFEKFIGRRRFLSRYFSPNELTKCSKNRLASRFAAKEALIKALGGFPCGASLKEMWVENAPSGSPKFCFSDNVKSAIDKKIGRKTWRVHLSLSDEREMAIAFVVISI